MPLPLLQKELGHATIAETMRYAEFHPDYSDHEPYFDRVAERFGVLSGPKTGTTRPEPSGREEE